MTVTLRITSKLFKLYDLQITILKIDSVNCKHIGRDVTHTIGALHQLKQLPLCVWHASWLLNQQFGHSASFNANTQLLSEYV